MSNAYDAIVVGGGHNGLVAAARSGARTLVLEQLFHMRPAPGYADYRTPIAGLYNGSSATHAGGGVCGIPGWQAARAVLKDRRRIRLRLGRRAS